MNEFKFYGRALEKPELIETEKGYKYCNLLISVERAYKNGDNPSCDEFKVTLFKNVASEACERIKKGNNVIVKGRLQQNNFDKDSGEIVYRPELVGEKIYYTD